MGLRNHDVRSKLRDGHLELRGLEEQLELDDERLEPRDFDDRQRLRVHDKCMRLHDKRWELGRYRK